MYDDKPNWVTGEKNIYRNADGSFTIRRYVDGRRITFAVFKNIVDAVKYRDYCESHNWDPLCKRRKSSRMRYISDMEMKENVVIV